MHVVVGPTSLLDDVDRCDATKRVFVPFPVTVV